MAQNPIRKVQIRAKPTKYKKVLKTPKRDAEIVSKQINKRALERIETKYKLSAMKKS